MGKVAELRGSFKQRRQELPSQKGVRAMATKVDLGPLESDSAWRSLPEWSEASMARFRELLESREGIGSLPLVLREVLPKARQTEEELPRLLSSAVVRACYGAMVFERLDWRDLLRTRLQSFHSSKGDTSYSLRGSRLLLQQHPEQETMLARQVEARLRVEYDQFRFPKPEEFFIRDFLATLADAIEGPTWMDSPERGHMRSHGCLDHGRLIEGNQVRSTKSMLAFNLEFIFRSASSGGFPTVGNMPSGGRPHRAITVLKLTPFRGHLILTEEGVRHADPEAPVSGGVPPTDGRTGCKPGARLRSLRVSSAAARRASRLGSRKLLPIAASLRAARMY